ncbi:CRISPR-associated endonuclease Cas2 [Nautilia sp.]
MVVIAYDIKDEKRLKKIAKFLEKEGVRAQRSVFEADISVRKANKIFKEMEEIIDKKEDKLFLFKIIKKNDIQANTSIERIF